MDLHGVLSDIDSAFSPSSSFWVRFELKLYGTVIVCIDTMLFDVKDTLDYLLYEFIAMNKGKERQERYDEQEEEEEKQSKFEQKRKESVKKKAKRESISNAEEEDNEEKEITEDATENIDVGIRQHLVHSRLDMQMNKTSVCYLCSFNDLDSPVNKAGSAGRLKAVYVRTEHGVLFEVFSSYNKNLQALLQNLSITAIAVLKNFYVLALQSTDPNSSPVNPKLSHGSLLVRLVTTGELLKVAKNVKHTNNLPIGSLGLTDERWDRLVKHLSTVCNEMDIVFVLGAMSHGKIECDYVEEFVASKSSSSFTHPL
ncbi:hypothetical protein YC2023_077770 [Brassica napus]